MGSKVNGAAPVLENKSEPVAGSGQQQQVPNPLPQRIKPIRLKNHSVCSESYDTLHRSATPVSIEHETTIFVDKDKTMTVFLMKLSREM